MKKILLLCLLCIPILGCSDESEKSEDTLYQGQVQTEMKEVLSDGSEKVIEPLSKEGEEFVAWKVDKEDELQQLIVSQLGLKEEFILINVAKISNEELAISIVLDSEEKFNNELIQTLIENIISINSNQNSLSIKEENIIIMNNKNVILY